ncbi:murein L,D-transpeptidase catalytic domain family protein [Hymenobacter persicinus]|uniref:Murein L,D-transpeptidase catalytic domain family protein n=1 Tax=Hymenobacter persicinus TaxID=2025506 RepID=A0A4Q5L6B0_9BACT|nr:murein L,D-transpeptidase catalytic domain family protein [Hymenobacter persicinus]RYU74170.1 murein L,D-transpeptidase catalytic domain family protein [Hymenobacter persicinus]
MTSTPTAFAGLLLVLLSFFSGVESAAAAPGNGGGAVVKLTGPRRATYMAAFEQHVLQTYVQTGLTTSGLPINVYREALLGFYNLQQRGQVSAQRQVLTIIDFNRSSRLKRLWVIDVKQQRVLFHTLVAHGKNTGEEFASAFSNQNGSEMSSLGFYVTGNTYDGKHGLSLKLNGLDAGYNTNAASRSVVVHGAEYVCEEFVRAHGRLGRSQGCPALPLDQSSAIIRAIKNGTVVYAHAPSGVRYESSLQELDPALLAFAQSKGLADD